MNNIKVTQKAVIKDPNLMLIKEKVENLCKASILQSISAKRDSNLYKYDFKDSKINKQEFTSLGTVFGKYYDTLSVESKKNFYKNVYTKNSSDQKLTQFISQSKIDLKKNLSVFEQFNFASDLQFVTNINAKLIENTFSSFVSTEFTTLATPAPAPKKIKEVHFKLESIKCLDETDPEFLGSDKIAIGGAATDDKGETSKISKRDLGSNFNDGTNVNFNPDLLFKRFVLNDNTYPKSFVIIPFLAEIDNGGFSDFLNEAYKSIKDAVAILLGAAGAAAGAWIGAQIGGTVGSAVAGPIGTIIGILAGLILGALIGWLVQSLMDDIFQITDEHFSGITLENASSNFNGNDTSPVYRMIFSDHNARYRLKYYWEIVRA
ncbi:hypothetical protein [Flavobacterium sp.]|uniref:hypothetical protein n=1 Tax=Flavobacterium sp. TaxID=239 RepID=UPI00260AD6C0|nr:hypothetical protein [Flavobacterium sp.]